MKNVKNIAVHICLFALALIWIFPVIWLILSSFKDGSELFTYPLTILPEHFTLANYATAWEPVRPDALYRKYRIYYHRGYGHHRNHEQHVRLCPGKIQLPLA